MFEVIFRCITLCSNLLTFPCTLVIYYCNYLVYCSSAASTLAANGAATLGAVVQVSLSTIYFEDYLIGSVTDVTSSWATKQCSTSGYTGFPSINDAGSPSSTSDDCSFSAANTLSSIKFSSAICLGFVKSVHYTVTHDTTTAASISAVTADVVITDVPMATINSTAVTVTQTYSVQFASDNPTAIASTDNGNLVKRYLFAFIQSINTLILNRAHP